MGEQLTTTQKGRGWQHQKAARRLRAAFREGDICRRCTLPMYSWQPLDAGHPDSTVPLRVLVAQGIAPLPDALEHRACNIRHGQRVRGNRQRQLPRW